MTKMITASHRLKSRTKSVLSISPYFFYLNTYPRNSTGFSPKLSPSSWEEALQAPIGGDLKKVGPTETSRLSHSYGPQFHTCHLGIKKGTKLKNHMGALGHISL